MHTGRGNNQGFLSLSYCICRFVLPIAKGFLERGGRTDLPDEEEHADDSQNDDADEDTGLAASCLGALDGLSSWSAGKKFPSAQEIPEAEMLSVLKQLLGC